MRALREQVDLLRDAMRRRGADDGMLQLIDRGEGLDRERRSLIQAVEERKAARNNNSQEVARRKKAKESADELITRGRDLGEEIARLESDLETTEGQLRSILLELPNVTLPNVPAGGEECNRVVKEWRTPRDSAGVRPHWEIGAALGIIDLERASKISGSGFVCYRALGARLVRALINFFIDLHSTEHGYQETWPPVLV